MAAALLQLARKYVWWEPPEQALAQCTALLCQLMELGTFDDVRFARRALGDAAFQEALREAPPGLIDARSWSYWNHFFGNSPIPPRPTRRTS